MRNWRVFLVVVGFALGGFALGAESGFELKGQLNASETELEEGYFALAEDTTLVVRPGTAMHRWLREHAGQRIRLLVDAAPGTQ